MRQLRLLVHNVDGVQDPHLHPGSLKNEAIVQSVRAHHVAVLVETRTNAMERVMEQLHSTHKLVHATCVPSDRVGCRGHGLAVLASNACADMISVHSVVEDMHAVILKCDGMLFGLAEPVMLCAVYVNPKGNSVLTPQDMLLKIADDLAAASQVSPHLLVCGDFNAHIGGLREVSDAHVDLLRACPDLSLPRRAVCSKTNRAGSVLVDVAAALNCVITTGRVCGDDGQPSCFVTKQSGRIGQSRPDHVLLTGELFCAVQSVCIDQNLTPGMFDHCPLSMNFAVLEGSGDRIDWAPFPEHVCKPCGCGEKLSLKWDPACAQAYAQYIDEDEVMLPQFHAACEQGDVEKACFCIRSLIDHAASAVGMARHVSVCAPLRRQRAGQAVSRPPWFDGACKMRKRELLNAVRTGQAVHAVRFLKKQYRVQTRRSKRTHIRAQRAKFLDLFWHKHPELHAMLRKPKPAQHTPLTSQAWEQYLVQHFQAQEAQGRPPSQPRVHASDMAVPLGRGHPPPEELLRQGAARGWVPEPDEFFS